jgi:carbonic anhydrase
MPHQTKLIKLIKWHLPFMFYAFVFTAAGAVIYFKWYELKPMKGLNENTYVRLIEGNKRFAEGHSIHPDESIKYRKTLTEKQKPFAVIITCSDSRISPELIFDQGLGDLFVIRTAGNLLSEIEMGSVEYAVEHLDVNTIIVMGHEGCGAVKALMSEEHFNGHIQTIVDSLIQEPEVKFALSKKSLNAAISGNVLHQVNRLKQNFSQNTLSAGHKKSLMIEGLIYSIEKGTVVPVEFATNEKQSSIKKST